MEYSHCTLCGATGSVTADGKAVIASSTDDPFTTRTRVVVEAPAGGYKFVAAENVPVTHSAFVSWERAHMRGVNERGLAFTMSWVQPLPDGEPDCTTAEGINFERFGWMLLGEAASVAEGIELLEGNQRAIHGNFLLADAAGEMALVEVGTRSLNVETRITDGWLARTNHWVSPEMRDKGHSGDQTSSTMVRLRRIEELGTARLGQIDIAYLAECYADHATLAETGWAICGHGHEGPQQGVRLGTVSAEIMAPAERTMHYCYGWPCGGAVDYPGEQLYQDRSWGRFEAFCVDDLEPGEYVTVDGRRTPLANRCRAT